MTGILSPSGREETEAQTLCIFWSLSLPVSSLAWCFQSISLHVFLACDSVSLPNTVEYNTLSSLAMIDSNSDRLGTVKEVDLGTRGHRVLREGRRWEHRCSLEKFCDPHTPWRRVRLTSEVTSNSHSLNITLTVGCWWETLGPGKDRCVNQYCSSPEFTCTRENPQNKRLPC